MSRHGGESYIVLSYIVVRSLEGQRVAPADDALSDRAAEANNDVRTNDERCRIVSTCQVGSADSYNVHRLPTLPSGLSGERTTMYEATMYDSPPCLDIAQKYGKCPSRFQKYGKCPSRFRYTLRLETQRTARGKTVHGLRLEACGFSHVLILGTT